MWLGSFSAETLLERQTPEGSKPEVRRKSWGEYGTITINYGDIIDLNGDLMVMILPDYSHQFGDLLEILEAAL